MHFSDAPEELFIAEAVVGEWKVRGWKVQRRVHACAGPFNSVQLGGNGSPHSSGLVLVGNYFVNEERFADQVRGPVPGSKVGKFQEPRRSVLQSADVLLDLGKVLQDPHVGRLDFERSSIKANRFVVVPAELPDGGKIVQRIKVARSYGDRRAELLFRSIRNSIQPELEAEIA